MAQHILVIVLTAGLGQHAKFHFGLVAQITTVLGTKNIAKAVELTRDVSNVLKIVIAPPCKRVKRTSVRGVLVGAETDPRSDKTVNILLN